MIIKNRQDIRVPCDDGLKHRLKKDETDRVQIFSLVTNAAGFHQLLYRLQIDGLDLGRTEGLDPALYLLQVLAGGLGLAVLLLHFGLEIVGLFLGGDALGLVLLRGLLVAVLVGILGEGLLDVGVHHGLFHLDLLLGDLLGVPDLRRLLDSLQGRGSLLKVLDEGELEGHRPVDPVRPKVIKAVFVQRNDLLRLPEPGQALAGGHQNLLVVVARLPKNLYHIDVGGLADDLAGLVELQGATQGGGVVHPLHATLNPFVNFRGGTHLEGGLIKAIHVAVAELVDRPETPFAVHHLQDRAFLIVGDPEADGMIQTPLADGTFQFLHLGTVYALRLGLSIMVHEPSGIPVDQTTVARTQTRLGKPDAVPLYAEEVAPDVLYLVAELLLNTCRIFDDHADLREYGKKR